MNKKAWLGIGIGAVVIIVLVIVATTSKKSADQNSVASNVTSTTQIQEEQSLKDLLVSGKSVKCDYSSTQADGSAVSGTSYIAQGKIKGDFTSTAASGKVVGGHMILSNNVAYTWIDGMQNGFKFGMSITATTSSAHTSTNETVDVNKKMNYHCDSWSPTATSFDVPTTITFQDMSAMMKAGATTNIHASVGSSPKAGSQCSACDSVPTQYQAQCRAQMCK